MITFIKKLFAKESKPIKGLMAVEWSVIIYLIITLFIILFLFTDLKSPIALIKGRIQILLMITALWGIYRIYPSRFTKFARITVQLALLSWWYPDTYELNRLFPNLDHIIARWEQAWFGCQPALYFAKELPDILFSELFDMGYAAYYPMIALTVMYYFIFRYKEFHRVAFIILTSFFIYYLIYIFFPVVGPTYYYKAIGLKAVADGYFPSIGNYFNFHQSCLPSPGYTNGLFYHLVERAKDAGERPTAAFPSSHVGISTICMLLLWRSNNRKLTYCLIPIYFLLCCATVYIQAHYFIDVIGGFISAIIIYFTLLLTTSKLIEGKQNLKSK